MWSDNKWNSCFVKRKQPSLPVLSGTRDPVIYRCCTLHTLCTVHCTLYTVHCTLCTVHCTLYVHPLYVGCMLSGYCPLAVGCRGTSCTVYHLLYSLCPICITVQLFMLCLTVNQQKLSGTREGWSFPGLWPGKNCTVRPGKNHTVSPKPYLRQTCRDTIQ